jgi:hypothetical protein
MPIDLDGSDDAAGGGDVVYTIKNEDETVGESLFRDSNSNVIFAFAILSYYVSYQTIIVSISSIVKMITY